MPMQEQWSPQVQEDRGDIVILLISYQETAARFGVVLKATRAVGSMVPCDGYGFLVVDHQSE
jgi:hypothetical protein